VLEQFESFEQAWRSQDHRRSGDLERELDGLLKELDRERRRSRVVLTICGLYTLTSTIAIAVIFSQRAISIAEVWPAIGAQAIALVALSWLLRTRYLNTREADMRAAPVKEAASIALQATDSGIRGLKLAAIAMAAIVALTALAMANLYKSGKMDEKAISSLGAVLALVVVFNALALWLKMTRRHGPRRQRLRGILRDL